MSVICHVYREDKKDPTRPRMIGLSPPQLSYAEARKWAERALKQNHPRIGGVRKYLHIKDEQGILLGTICYPPIPKTYPKVILPFNPPEFGK